MKKIFKILLTVLITFGVFISFDMLFFYHIVNENKKVRKSVEKWVTTYGIPSYFIKLKSLKESYEKELLDLRPVMNPDSKMDSIIIFGCSYAYGYVFPNEQTISYVMSKYSKRPIYNRAINGWGIQHVIYQLRDENFYKEIKTRPKYIFYVLMGNSGHFRRLYYTCFPNIDDINYYFGFKNRNGKLEERKPFLNLYYNFAIFRHIQNKLIDRYVDINFWEKPNKKLFDFFILHFKTINELLKTLWGGGRWKYSSINNINF